MRVEADYKKIYTLGDYLVDEAEEYKAKIDKMIEKLECLEAYWSGPDYDNYKEVYKTYLMNAKTTYIELNAFGNALKKVAYLYNDGDNTFGSQMRKLGNENGRKQVKL